MGWRERYHAVGTEELLRDAERSGVEAVERRKGSPGA